METLDSRLKVCVEMLAAEGLKPTISELSNRGDHMHLGNIKNN